MGDYARTEEGHLRETRDSWFSGEVLTLVSYFKENKCKLDWKGMPGGENIMRKVPEV